MVFGVSFSKYFSVQQQSILKVSQEITPCLPEWGGEVRWDVYLIESHLSLSLLTEIRQVAVSMARLDVSNIISQWLHHLETDQGMMDRLEVVYRARYEVGEQQSLVEPGRCCVKCDCRDSEGGCVREEEVEGSGSVLTRYSYQCGCEEETYTYQGRRLGRSRRTRCDGALNTTDYRSVTSYGVTGGCDSLLEADRERDTGSV